jgi:imidazolonepropionase-like amidohydrolase
MFRQFATCVGGAWALCLSFALPLSAETLAIQNVTLIDGTGAAPRSGVTVVVDGNTIAAVGDSQVTIPSGAKRIDGSGKYLIPGLMDIHVHVPGSAARNQGGEGRSKR